MEFHHFFGYCLTSLPQFLFLHYFQNYQEDAVNIDEQGESREDQLFDQDTNEDEDFEIPAFLRRQKF